MMEIRKTAVAGAFYPSSKNELRDVVSGLLRAAYETEIDLPHALIVPHAGYIYSGPVAAVAYRTLQNFKDVFKKVILLGPAHHVFTNGLVLPEVEAFETPLGVVPIDREFRKQAESLPGVSINDLPHKNEHALEVQLPFLQLVLNQFSILPVVVGSASPIEISNVLSALNLDETLIVVSSDLSHYLPYDVAKEQDATTAEQILEFDELKDDNQACGSYPLNGFFHYARNRNLKARLLDLRNSGDIAGDRSRVVGYGSFAVSTQ